jgi:ribosomal protein S12 methylthiotransferase accessory factor
MEMEISFPGGARVDAEFGSFTVKTDQPPMGGGEGAAPTPFALFLSSIGTCAGIYILGFLRKRGLSSEGVSILQRMRVNPMTGMVSEVDLDIQVPSDFPEKYYDALVRSAELCAVKKHFETPPMFNIKTRVRDVVVSN